MLRGAPTGPAGGVASADLVERSRRGRRSSAPAAAPAVPTGSNRAAAPGGVPRRRLDSALLLYAQSAVTRAIYSHTREYLAVAEPGRGQEGRTAPGRRVFAAVRRAARAIILKCSVIKVLSEAREEKRQVSAKKAEVLWRRLSLQIPFVFDFVLDSAPGSPGAQAEHSAAVATKVAAELAKLLADFEGADALQLKFRSGLRGRPRERVCLSSTPAARGRLLPAAFRSAVARGGTSSGWLRHFRPPLIPTMCGRRIDGGHGGS